MGIILDADVIIRGERGEFSLEEWLQTQSEVQFSIAAITVAELWHGVERSSGRRRSAREKFLQRLLAPITVLDYTIITARIHAKLWATLASAGTPIGAYDLIVAATALETANELATFNQRHFSCVKGLKIIQPE